MTGSTPFPAEDLTGLSPGTLTAITAARTEAFWRDHGIALDVRPVEGARWLERHGRHHLYRIYANEWWHFEYQPHTHSAPPRLPHPGPEACCDTVVTIPGPVHDIGAV